MSKGGDVSVLYIKSSNSRIEDDMMNGFIALLRIKSIRSGQFSLSMASTTVLEANRKSSVTSEVVAVDALDAD